jgi:hypothetical protein
MQPVVELRRGCSESWMTAFLRWGPGQRGEFARLIGAEIRVQTMMRGAAGDIDGGSGLRVTMGRSFGCRLEHVKGIRRCAGLWRSGQRRGGGLGLTGGGGIDRRSSQHCGDSASNLIVSVASCTGGRKGVGGGAPGVFMGGRLLAVGARVFMDLIGWLGRRWAPAELCPDLEEGADMWD